ncbi:glycosyltransferase [Macrococcus animalis]|uniref:glycosyltransferase n=1 Tax=Macrococcus animalis TaxID=3395467 RepID=UPI0039BE3E82
MFLWNNFTNDARVTREAKSLAKNGYQVNIICKKEKDEMDLLSKESFQSGYTATRLYKTEIPNFIIKRFNNKKIKTLLSKHLPNGFLMLKMIRQGFKDNSDVYHSHDLNTLIQGVVCAKFRQDKKILVFDSHEVNTSRTNYNIKIVGIVEKILLRFVDKTIVENDTRGRYHELLYGIKPVSLHNYSELYNIDNVVPINLYKVFNIIPKKIFLYQGGLQAGRGLEQLIHSFHDANIDAYLFFVGDGKLRAKLQQLVHQLNMNEKVFFTGRVPYMELRSYTKSAYVGFQILQKVNFNHYSASSNKLYEYMMAHIPVIATNMPEIKNVVEKENIGIVIEENNQDQLTKAIIQLYNDESLHEKYKENMSVAKEKYNWSKEQKVLLDFYNEIFEVNASE